MKLTTEQKQELVSNYRRLNTEEKQFIRQLMASPARAIVPKLFGSDIAELLKMIPAQTQNMRSGGMVQEAQRLAEQGRGNDSMLVHMTPSEVQGLQALARRQGDSLTINPSTGLPEAGKLEDEFKKVMRVAGPVLPFIFGPQVGITSLAGQAAASGLIAGLAAPGKGINFDRGIKTGLLAYGLGSAYNAMNPNAPIGAPAGGGTNSVSVGGPSTATTGGGAGNVSAGKVDMLAYGDPTFYSPQTNAALLAPPPPTVSPTTAATAGTAGTAAAKPDISKFQQVTGIDPTLALIGGNMAYGAYQAGKEMDLAKQQLAAVQAEEERKKREGRLAFENSLARIDQPVYAAGGGLMALGKGGTTGPTNEPRVVKGAGDGMSDDVPATIEGVQEARLANDEFVVPADVVADIGNGSSSAGANKLYMMMDRVRKARHGTTEQPPEINARKYMPA
jgi:hypothetical protein